jgi:superfamily II DNA helicase RecQ
VAVARRSEIPLTQQIQECEDYQVIFVDPEHLKDREWREITACSTFQDNVVFGSMDELHLSEDWAKDFRKAFRVVGRFLRGRLPAHVSINGMTATLRPGESTQLVCHNLGFFKGQFREIRLSNERPNMHIALQLINKRSTTFFSFLDPYIVSNRKTIIYVPTLDELFRVFIYLWRAIPDNEKLTRIRMYHATLPDGYNDETVRLMESSPQLQIIVATVAITHGINIKGIQDCLATRVPKTLNSAWQFMGRGGRQDEGTARGVFFATKAEIKAAEKRLSGILLDPPHVYLCR